MARIEPLGAWLTDAPWKSRQVVLIQDGECANTIGEKRQMLRDDPDSPTLVAWAGQWSTTIRYAAPEERRDLASKL